MVGAVVVSADGVIVGQGYHERAGEPHAEVHALDAAGVRARGATLYVTLEPCCHVGRTGPCTERVIAAGVTRVVAAMRDPDPRMSGKGFDVLRAAGIQVDVGVCEADARRLNQPFITMRTLQRPLVVVKAATSLDGCVAKAPGERTDISSPEANRRSHVLRASIDAIAVGSETARIDDPLLTARLCHRERPLVRVIFDRRLRASPRLRVFSTLAEGPVIIVTKPIREGMAPAADALRGVGAQLLEADTLMDALHALAARDVSTLLVEGGPTLQHAFAAAGLVDRVHLIVAPVVFGARGVHWLPVDSLGFAHGAVVAEPRGTDIWIEADVHRHC
jgi:diaminohydroxyphosphoribosylaminopyrimidine deaminase/5-amino-6-(5-phosphoribosylamino)uracil reductase